MSKAAVDKLAKTVEALQAQLAELTAKIALLEGEVPEPSQPAPAEPQQAPPAPESIPEEILLAISAAVAAYLGERAHVRAVRLISTSRWSQQGRVSIQASHRLERG